MQGADMTLSSAVPCSMFSVGIVKHNTVTCLQSELIFSCNLDHTVVKHIKTPFVTSLLSVA